MRGIFLLAIAFIWCAAAQAQGVRAGDGQPVNSAVYSSGPISTVAYASISICGNPANAVPCTNKVTTYTDYTLGTPCSTSTQVTLAGSSTCQATTDGLGNWGVWLPGSTTPYSYTITLSTGQSYGPYYFTPGGGTAGVTTFNGRGGAVSLTLPDLAGVSGAGDLAGLGITITGAYPTQTINNTGSPLTTLGDTLSVDSTPALVRIAGNSASNAGFYCQTGTGSISALPAWCGLTQGTVFNGPTGTPTSEPTLGISNSLDGKITLCSASNSGCATITNSSTASDSAVAIPSATGTLSIMAMAQCVATGAACTPITKLKPVIEVIPAGQISLSAGTVTITGLGPFTAMNSFGCTANDAAGTVALQVTNVSASSITVTAASSVNDTIVVTCAGS